MESLSSRLDGIECADVPPQERPPASNMEDAPPATRRTLIAQGPQGLATEESAWDAPYYSIWV